MPSDIYITRENITDDLLTWDQIIVEAARSAAGSYTALSTIDLVAGQYYYHCLDATGDPNRWYRYKLYNSVSSAVSQPSDPFRPQGTTRLRIRQHAISEYRAGMVISAITGSNASLWKTSDYRIASSLLRAGQYKGTWLMPTATRNLALAGQTRLVLSNVDPTIGELPVSSWDDLPEPGDEAELHWLASPEEWNDAINRGMNRYYYLDRIPLVGVAGQYDYDLSFLPWLKKDNLHGVWYTPVGSSIEQPYIGGGKWYRPHEDRGILTLTIYPAIDTSVTLYLECSRPMSPLYTDTAQPPVVCDEALASALAWDETLAMLTRPGSGATQDRRTWQAERRAHAVRLRKLLVANRPRPRFVPAQLSQPSAYSPPYSAR